ncbi:hypothetical protein [Dyadobacter sediminis]|uniref:hypothetical protein n=1 Tax=Dyadobacter sediminis TaxID=1493691 RepID=UPI001486AEDD|nr:hypothetical protein [Dyadobacter sediminis]GGC09900.1 hypothetical protein GCM10011325_40960 [Dyadobacter sediminis]
MKVSEPKKNKINNGIKAAYDPSLDNLPIPRAALEKTEKARAFFEKHPLPEHLLRK